MASPYECCGERGFGGPWRRRVLVIDPGGPPAARQVVVIWFDDESKLPGPAVIPGEGNDLVGSPPRLRLEDEPSGFAEHREVRGS